MKRVIQWIGIVLLAAGALALQRWIGTTDDFRSRIEREASAAVGTVLLPGVGTGAGASVGDKVGEGFKKLFGQ